MNIIEICKVEKHTVWNEDKTFLSVFDANGRQVADYDFCTGLKIIQNNQNMTIFINNEDLVAGSWKFIGVKRDDVTGQEELVQSQGFKDGTPSARTYSSDNPWNGCRVFGSYVSATERESRMNICRSCQFFRSDDGVCTINNAISVETTKQDSALCPDKKWGDAEKAMEAIRNKTLSSEEMRIEQEAFDRELERYLEGL